MHFNYSIIIFGFISFRGLIVGMDQSSSKRWSPLPYSSSEEISSSTIKLNFPSIFSSHTRLSLAIVLKRSQYGCLSFPADVHGALLSHHSTALHEGRQKWSSKDVFFLNIGDIYFVGLSSFSMARRQWGLRLQCAVRAVALSYPISLSLLRGNCAWSVVDRNNGKAWKKKNVALHQINFALATSKLRLFIGNDKPGSLMLSKEKHYWLGLIDKWKKNRNKQRRRPKTDAIIIIISR